MRAGGPGDGAVDEAFAYFNIPGVSEARLGSDLGEAMACNQVRWHPYPCMGRPRYFKVQYSTSSGDASDNVPGAPGVGPKTAAKRLGEYGDLDGVLAAAAYMVAERVPVLDAVRRCRAVRGGACLGNRGFQQALVRLAAAEGLLGTMPAPPAGGW